MAWTWLAILGGLLVDAGRGRPPGGLPAAQPRPCGPRSAARRRDRARRAVLAGRAQHVALGRRERRPQAAAWTDRVLDRAGAERRRRQLVELSRRRSGTPRSSRAGGRTSSSSTTGPASTRTSASLTDVIDANLGSRPVYVIRQDPSRRSAELLARYELDQLDLAGGRSADARAGAPDGPMTTEAMPATAHRARRPASPACRTSSRPTTRRPTSRASSTRRSRRCRGSPRRSRSSRRRRLARRDAGHRRRAGRAPSRTSSAPSTTRRTSATARRSGRASRRPATSSSPSPTATASSRSRTSAGSTARLAADGRARTSWSASGSSAPTRSSGPLYARAYRLANRIFFGLRVPDVDCACKLFRREALEGIPVESGGAFFSAELLIKLGAAGRSIAEVGVPHYPRTAGSRDRGEAVGRRAAVRDFWRLRLRMWVNRARSLAPRGAASSATEAGRSSSPGRLSPVPGRRRAS